MLTVSSCIRARVATSYPANRPVPFTLALDSLLRVVGNRRCIA